MRIRFLTISLIFLFVAVNSEAQYKGGSYDGYTSILDTNIPYPVGIKQISNIAAEYKLLQNYPNPFNPFTNIKFSLYKGSIVGLKVFDITGRNVYTIIENKYFQEGVYDINFDGRNFNSGIYFYTIETETGFTDTKKMIIIK